MAGLAARAWRVSRRQSGRQCGATDPIDSLSRRSVREDLGLAVLPGEPLQLLDDRVAPPEELVNRAPEEGRLEVGRDGLAGDVGSAVPYQWELGREGAAV
jgi:hypothetical protein